MSVAVAVTSLTPPMVIDPAADHQVTRPPSTRYFLVAMARAVRTMFYVQ